MQFFGKRGVFLKDAVSIVKCPDYDKVEESVNLALEYIGGIERFVKKGDRVCIKPNYVLRKNPDDAATTHPAVLKAVVKKVLAAGGEVVVAESPGGVYSEGILKALYSTCGANDAVLGTNAKLNYDTSFSEVSFPEGKTLKNFPIINPILDADVIISLPKLKTHSMTNYTGAVKNLFGVIPGTYKAELHFRLNEKKAFCSMLLDLCECVKPTLSIMDAVVAMEGEGPTAGQNRKVGLIMASANPYAMDLVCTNLIDYAPEEVETVMGAYKRGLFTKNISEVEILGEKLEPLVIKDFKKPDTHFDLLKLLPLPSAVRAWITDIAGSRPKINYDECIGCGECSRCCPPKAIVMEKNKPRIDKKACIKCFCCQELCPKKAVKIKRSFVNKVMLKFSR